MSNDGAVTRSLSRVVSMLWKHTLGAVEGAVLRALGEGTVEERGESSFLGVAESIVHPDKLLEGLATVEGIIVSKDVPKRVALLGAPVWECVDDEVCELLTCYRYVP